MSGDVQPRKRKDKKKKKDDLGIEEPRGTAAALGEGDIFMHSYQEHGTGGHWCAKVIFFSLLAVLVTLIGLIILENRGISDLEANSVESRYAGVLEGWLEEGHNDDHHDEHTLDLNHHDDEDDDDHGGELDHDDDELEHDDDEENGHDDDDEEDENEEHDDDDDDESLEDDDGNDDEQDGAYQEGNDDVDSQEANDDDEQNEDSEEQNLETAEDEDEVEEPNYRRYYQSSQNQANDDDADDDDDDDDDLQKVNYNDDDDESAQNDDEDNQLVDEDNNDGQENDDDDDDENLIDDTNDEDDNEDSDENNQDNEDEDDHDDHQEESSEVELEHIEDEVFDDVSTEAPAQARDDKSDEEDSNEANPLDDANEDDVEFLEPDDDDDDDLPEVLPIPIPKGKPLVEVEETSSTEKPQDTLADEEEYEREQEALRRDKEQASQGMWLKLVVGGALLVATQAVLRRATAPRDTEDEVDTTREESPLSDRRMTLIAEPVAPPPVIPKPQEVSRPVVQREVVKQVPVVKSSPPPPEDEEEEIEEEEEEEIMAKDVEPATAKKDAIDLELYSDEDEAEDEEEEIIEEKKEPPKPAASKPPAPIKEIPKLTPFKETTKPIEKKEAPKPVEKEPTPEEDDDVEIIEDEDFGEELEEEEDISDVDDAELLTRLDAKYGRLPEPEIPGRKKDGGNSIEDEWPGEPSDAYWRDELDNAERDHRQGEWTAAVERASAAQLRSSARARYIIARALDSAAEAKRDNGLLTKAIAAYLELLKMNEQLSDKKLIEVTDRALDRIKFRGNYLGAEPIYRLLIRRYPNDLSHRNNLAVSFLMANRVDLAEEAIKETLKRWPNDRIALAHHGFILKTVHNKLEEAVDVFTKALEGDKGPANESRFYYHLGDSLLLLGRFKEAEEVHKRGAKLGHFLSPAQRSLYNVDRLKSKPWWNLEHTPYTRLARALEMSWKEVLKEGLAAHALYEKEKEGLKERGEWSQLDLFVRGREVPNRCSRAPVTCSIVRSEVAASGCRRGQVKFSSMEAGTHVRPHVGPTNCRLRMHLGLSNTKDTYIRVDQETRQWQTGKVLMFDDSFEHEVWHNGTGTRLVLIVDVWHPDLTPNERRQLPAI